MKEEIYILRKSGEKRRNLINFCEVSRERGLCRWARVARAGALSIQKLAWFPGVSRMRRRECVLDSDLAWDSRRLCHFGVNDGVAPVHLSPQRVCQNDQR